MRARCWMGAADFYIGGDFNIELKLETTSEDIWGLDSIDWYGIDGLECRGGGEGVIFSLRRGT